MERSQVVTNGCSGKCCEKFTFQYSIEQLEKFIAEPTTHNFPLEELQKIRDMLIPLGETTICPKTEKDFTELHKEIGWTTDRITQENFKHYIVKDGVISSLIFTCKHFDTEKRICGNYENRPDMCKRYTCDQEVKYKGCQLTCQLKNSVTLK